jgi:rare lipoprotein A
MGMTRARFTLFLAAASALAVGCATVPAPADPPMSSAEVGMASFYGAAHEGQRTASGSRYHPDRLTAAHRTLPFGSRARVTNLDNGRSVIVTITDRGPFRKGRIIDLSKRAARRLGFVRQGTARVRVEPLGDSADARR